MSAELESTQDARGELVSKARTAKAGAGEEEELLKGRKCADMTREMYMHLCGKVRHAPHSVPSRGGRAFFNRELNECGAFVISASRVLPPNK